MKIKKAEIKRFYKQIILKKLGVNGQKKIFKAKILIVGMGGLGCPLLLYLANSGVKNIGIIDDDKIEISNGRISKIRTIQPIATACETVSERIYMAFC